MSADLIRRSSMSLRDLSDLLDHAHEQIKALRAQLAARERHYNNLCEHLSGLGIVVPKVLTPRPEAPITAGNETDAQKIARYERDRDAVFNWILQLRDFIASTPVRPNVGDMIRKIDNRPAAASSETTEVTADTPKDTPRDQILALPVIYVENARAILGGSTREAEEWLEEQRQRGTVDRYRGLAGPDGSIGAVVLDDPKDRRDLPDRLTCFVDVDGFTEEKQIPRHELTEVVFYKPVQKEGNWAFCKPTDSQKEQAVSR